MRLTELPRVRISPRFGGALVAGAALAFAALACGGSTSTEGSGQSGASPPKVEAGQTKEVSTGDAPTFSAETFEHGNFDLAEFAGQPVVINFWFPSCPPCRAEMPDLQEAFIEFKDRGVQFVGVQQLGIDSKASGVAFLKDVGVEYVNIADENAVIQLDYKILAYPTTVFLDRNHDIVKRWNGLITKEDLREQIMNIVES